MRQFSDFFAEKVPMETKGRLEKVEIKRCNGDHNKRFSENHRSPSLSLGTPVIRSLTKAESLQRSVLINRAIGYFMKVILRFRFYESLSIPHDSKWQR